MSEDFVRKDIFELHMQRTEAVTALNLEAQKAMNKRLEEKIDAFSERMNQTLALMNERIDKKFTQIDGKIDVLSERIDKNLAQYEAIVSNTDGEIKAINARLDTQQTKIGWYLTIFGLVITIVIAAIQLWK